MVPTTPQEVYLSGGCLSDDCVTCKQHVRSTTNRREVHAPEVVPKQVGAVWTTINECNQEFMIVGVVRCGSGIGLHYLPTDQVLHVTTVGRLPTEGVSEERSEVTVGELLSIGRADTILKRTIPRDSTNAVERQNVTHRTDRRRRDRVPREWLTTDIERDAPQSVRQRTHRQ